jgi:hypothetical protein
MDRAPIHDLTLQARGLLVTEIRELLEGVYGLSAEGEFEPTESLPAVEALEEVRETRSRLETLLQDEERAGLEPPEAVEKLVKETAFTHLNRLVAFKMMESRKLMRGAIDRYHDSNGFKFYLADHPDDLALYESGSAAQNALGETPRDVAYRHFLLWQYGQVASEIRVLFDPDNIPSRLFPRPRVLKQLIDSLNAAEMQLAWAPTSDETIGWVYQYFNEEEKIEVFNRLYKKKQKIRRDDIPAATQLFTPRWIVKWLVQNTLGRHWLQMHPDSRLVEHLEYLVPLGGEIPKVALKPVRELELLDPACGTMHFGLVAFDLLVEMYREELERAGSPGWLEEPSVSRVEDIPSSIIENNLFGIDIDLRAVQLSALTLYLKAKSLNKQATFTRSNLACADVLPLDGSRLTEFLEEAGLTRPIYSRLIKGLWNRLQHMGLVGSLMRLEVGLDSLIRQEQQKAETELSNPHLPGFAAEQFETEAGQQEFWDMIRIQILQAFDEFARQQAERGVDQRYFVGEAQKGLRILDVMLRRYDVVFTNPPYMGTRSMNETMRDFMKSSYPDSKGDLYAGFIERCLEFLKEDGRLGMITQQSFMFITSYEKLRNHILRTAAIETMGHLGPRAFEEIAGEKVNTVMFTLRLESSARRRLAAAGTYIRLVEGEGQEKEVAFRYALDQLKAKLPDLHGLWQGVHITKEDLAEVRQEMLGDLY